MEFQIIDYDNYPIPNQNNIEEILDAYIKIKNSDLLFDRFKLKITNNYSLLKSSPKYIYEMKLDRLKEIIIYYFKMNLSQLFRLNLKMIFLPKETLDIIYCIYENKQDIFLSTKYYKKNFNKNLPIEDLTENISCLLRLYSKRKIKISNKLFISLLKINNQVLIYHDLYELEEDEITYLINEDFLRIFYMKKISINVLNRINPDYGVDFINEIDFIMKSNLIIYPYSIYDNFSNFIKLLLTSKSYIKLNIAMEIKKNFYNINNRKDIKYYQTVKNLLEIFNNYTKLYIPNVILN